VERAIEIWFDFGSPYSYLSVMRIEAAAARHGVTVHWRPFLLGVVFRALGWERSPLLLDRERGAYMWIDMARQCRKYQLPWHCPSEFPRRAVVPTRVALWGAQMPWVGEFCRRLMQLNFVADCPIEGEAVSGEVLTALGLPAGEIVAAAQAEGQKLRLREQTESARQRGVFGAPTFFVGAEMFWGNDRLDDALALAAWGVEA